MRTIGCYASYSIISGSPTNHQRACRIPSMRRILAMLGSAVFLIIAPGIVAGYVPWRICGWSIEAPLLGTYWFRLVGMSLIAMGLPLLLDSFARFALQGLGTPAPIFPTRHLVVTGLFQYVRNPMYVAVVMLILGQGLFFGSARVVEYGIAVWVGFHLFVLIYEEPTLRKTYGPQYEEFCANVPRWIPRLRRWRRNPEQD
jgi:protein-S-isoprenylcysteine O-methyltransferase Ste14